MYNLNSEYRVPAVLPGDYDTEVVNFRGWVGSLADIEGRSARTSPEAVRWTW
mgnify:FL=1|jgi:hypothetical protein